MVQKSKRENSNTCQRHYKNSAGNCTESTKLGFQELAAGLATYRNIMKGRNFQNPDIDPIAKNMENFIEQNLPECKKAGGVKKPITQIEILSDQDLIIDVDDDDEVKENEGVDDCGCLQPPGTDSTPTDQKPPLTSVLGDAPRKPFAHFPWIYQRPKRLFEKKTTDSDWEKVYNMGYDKSVSVTQFRGRKSVHIRQFYNNKYNRSPPTQTRLELNPDEWNNLTLIKTDVNEALQL